MTVAKTIGTGAGARVGWTTARIAGLAAGSLLLAATGCLSLGGGIETGDIGDGERGYSDDRGAVQMVSTNIQGKNVYIPATVVLPEGTGRTLSIFNTTDTPHGFRIASLGVEAILQPGVEHTVTLPALEAGRIHLIDCQLHPPHRHATLVVVRAR